MTANTNRFSTYTSVSAGSGSKDNASAAAGTEKKKDLWSSMLDSVASGRRLPERHILVFGGSVDSQREFIESLALGDSARRGLDRQQNTNTKLPPVANNFALGYTYYDVLDADQEDILARISLHLLGAPAPDFAQLLQPLLTPQSIPDTLIVVLLDWAQPWLWLRQLREWILLLRTVLVSLSPECKEVMEAAMLRWRERGRGGALNLDGTTAAGTGSSTGTTGGGAEGGTASGGGGGDVALPPGPGEWEDALGLPLCVVCQNSEKTDILEKTQGWKDDEFDLVLQYLRTVLVKHGASLVYTTPGVPSQLPTLVHACLGVTSLLKRQQPPRPEVIKRTEVVVPPNWDSWTKILVVREGFEVEKVSEGWSRDLQRPFPTVPRRDDYYGDEKDGSGRRNGAGRHRSPAAGGDDAPEAEEYEDGPGEDDEFGNEDGFADDDEDDDPDSAVAQYERAIRDPGQDVLALAGLESPTKAAARHHRLEVETEDVQLFLGEQLKLLEQLRQKEEAKREKEAKESKRRGESPGTGSGSALLGLSSGGDPAADPAEVISSHIGPVQFNIGGIQVDADDMLERIKNRHYGSPEPMSPEPGAKTTGDDGAPAAGEPAGGATAGGNVDTEKMTAFFAGLMNRPSQTGKT